MMKALSSTTAFYLLYLGMIPPSAVVAFSSPSFNLRKASQGEDPIRRPLKYEQIQKIIDVARPYYKLENEAAIESSPDDINTTNLYEEQPMISFMCTVKPEMPLCREPGPMASAEAGRHMAIAGSIAAALNNSKKSKHYYLALKNELTSIALPDDVTTSSTSTSSGVESTDNAFTITARCIKVNKKEAECVITMDIPKQNLLWHLTVTYSVIPEKLFKRFSLKARTIFSKDLDEINSDNELMLSSSFSLTSPYAAFKGINTKASKMLWYSHKNNNRALSMQASIPKVPACHCLGHFDGNHALPVAFLAAYCFDLAGYSIGLLSDQDIPFRSRSDYLALSSFLPSDVTTSSSFHPSVMASKASTIHTTPMVEKEAKDSNQEALSCKLINSVMEAQKLVYANTHGIAVFCEVVQDPNHNSLFSVKITMKSDIDDDIIATMKTVWMTSVIARK
jgi:hypothetical protein